MPVVPLHVASCPALSPRGERGSGCSSRCLASSCCLASGHSPRNLATPGDPELDFRVGFIFVLWHNCCQVEESPLIMPAFPQEALLTPTDELGHQFRAQKYW